MMAPDPSIHTWEHARQSPEPTAAGCTEKVEG
jgi:hypothetical protein